MIAGRQEQSEDSQTITEYQHDIHMMSDRGGGIDQIFGLTVYFIGELAIGTCGYAVE